MSTPEPTPIFADWMHESYSFPEPGHDGTKKHHQIACWMELFADRLRITVHTECQSKNFNNVIRQRWTSGIRATWNNRFLLEADNAPGGHYHVPLSAPGTETPAVLRPQTWRVPIEFNPQFYPPGTNDPKRVNRSDDIIGIIDPAKHRGDTNYWWGKDHPDGETVEHNAAHEFGHYIGNADEYHLSRTDFEEVVGRPPTGDETMVLSDGTPTGFYSTLDSVMGLYQFQMPLRRHADQFVDWLNRTYVPQQVLVSQFSLVMADEVEHAPGDGISQEWEWYTVREGDWLSLIAEQHGMSWDQLYNYDPLGNDPNRLHLRSNDPDLIYPGEQIRVPVGA